MADCSARRYLRAEKGDTTAERIQNIISYLTHELWRYGSRGLYKQHKTLFTLLLAIKVDMQAGRISHDQFMTLSKVRGRHEDNGLGFRIGIH